MGLKDLPNRRLYWDRRHFFGCDRIKNVMRRERWEDILRCLHLVDNEGLVPDPQHLDHDKIAKTRWLLEKFAELSQQFYNCERHITVDEMIVAYKGRFCCIRQFMKGKPVRFGIKIWAAVSSKSRYVWSITVYLGAGTEREEGESVSQEAVLTAVRGLENRGHVIVTDNYFTSPKLLMELMRRGMWGHWHISAREKGLPDLNPGPYNERHSSTRHS